MQTGEGDSWADGSATFYVFLGVDFMAARPSPAA